MGRALIKTPEHEYKLLIFHMPTRKNRTRKLAKALYRNYGVSFVLAHRIAKAWMQASNNWDTVFEELQKELGLKVCDYEWFDKDDCLLNAVYNTNGRDLWVSICSTNVPLPQNFFDPNEPEYALINRG